MIGRNKTDQFGPNGLELNFYTDKQAGKNIRLVLPDEERSGHYESSKIVTMIFNPADFIGVMQLLYFINCTIDNIYEVHEKTKGQGIRTNVNSALYNIGIHSLIDNTAKLFSYLVFSQCVKTGGGIEKNTTFLTISELFNKKQNDDAFAIDVWANLFNENTQHMELFQTVEWVHQIFSSLNMFTNTRIFSPDLAAICAMESTSEPGFEYVYHNHSLRQLVLGLNDFLDYYFEFSKKRYGTNE